MAQSQSNKRCAEILTDLIDSVASGLLDERWKVIEAAAETAREEIAQIPEDEISLRDQFAMAAPIPLAADWTKSPLEAMSLNIVLRYAWADTFMEARKPKASSDKAGTE